MMAQASVSIVVKNYDVLDLKTIYFMNKKLVDCRYCGKLIDEKATFCTYCGKTQNASDSDSISEASDNAIYIYSESHLNANVLVKAKKWVKRISITIFFLLP